MRISTRDIKPLVDLLEQAMGNGDHIMSYNDDLDYLCAENVATFSSGFDAHAYHYENSTDLEIFRLAPVKPVFEKLLELKEKCLAFKGQEGNWSLPFDIPEIIINYQFNQEFKTMAMKKQNLEYLEEQLLYTGMGDLSREDLIKNMEKGTDTFQLPLEKKYGDDQVDVVANFRKSAQDYYFFNNYDLTVTSAAGERLTQNFRVKSPNPIQIQKENGELGQEWVNSTVTLKEAYNLTQGRSIEKNYVKIDKDNEANNLKYSRWSYLDFKETDQYGNYAQKYTGRFDLEKKLADYPIKELENDKYKNELYQSLRRGNLQSVSFQKGEDAVEKYSIQANPRFNGITVYDSEMRKVSLSMEANKDQSKTEEQAQQKGSGAQYKGVKENSNEIDEEGDPKKPKRNKNNDMSQSMAQ